MAFFSADEFDKTALGNPWNVAAIVMILLVALACFLWVVQPAGSPFAPYPGPHFGYDALP